MGYINSNYHCLCGSIVRFNKGLHLASHSIPDTKVHKANMGPTWGQRDTGGSNVGHMNIVIWDVTRPIYFVGDIFNYSGKN